MTLNSTRKISSCSLFIPYWPKDKDYRQSPLDFGRKITNWCSYVPALDEIVDITEVPIEWLQGGAATMIIMKKAKDN